MIVGEGPEARRLRAMAKSNITFQGWIENEQLRDLYRESQALIFPGEEDFGITALETQACGRPIIALRKGGVVETVLEHRTGLFFNEPTVNSLCQAVEAFKQSYFDRGVIRAHAERFGGDRCRRELDSTIRAILGRHGL